VMNIPKTVMRRAEGSDVDAHCRVAEILMSAETRRGYRKALRWLRRAGRAGDAWAEYHLGLIYNYGLAGRRDIKQAARWYERSAAKGYDSAQLNLGIILSHRRGRHRDLRRAVKLYRLAARQGRRNAAYNLGLYYEQGRGVPRSITQARRWYQRAADLGDRDARRALRALGKASERRAQRTQSCLKARAPRRKCHAARSRNKRTRP
jgi:uncharacterized protein